MNTDVIGSRYHLGPVFTCTTETTTWDARDAWLNERVLIVRPEPGCDKRFAALAGALLDRSSAYLVDHYDTGTTTRNVVVAESGEAVLSPWPLAPRPQNWSGPGGFGSDPDEPRDASVRDDVRALGAVLLAALAGPPLYSSEQVKDLERELTGRAPNAVSIADRALTSPVGRGH